jgi:hypothetical protein
VVMPVQLDAEWGEFEPGAFYNKPMDWLMILVEDAYISQSLRHGDVELLWNHAGDRIVGIKLWDISSRPGGSEALSRAGLQKP